MRYLKPFLAGILACLAIFAVIGANPLNVVTITDSTQANNWAINSSGQGPVAPDSASYYQGTVSITGIRKGGTDSSSGATTIVSAVGGKSIYVLYCALSGNGTVTANLQSHATTSNTTGNIYEVAGGGISTGYCPIGLFATTNGEALDLNLSGSTAVGWTIVYVAY